MVSKQPELMLPDNRGVSSFGALVAHRNTVKRALEYPNATPEAVERNSAILARLEQEIEAHGK